ncbi:protein-disulfide reductase DsbD family protein [Croceibacterium aestuarii]|uniref:protein-disulfide reductase DsbD family protein n=1 Tax=Croceibacterium aestuarii TaxID=3064139 RepID=UPI00272E0A2A|nr:protein-disulfide reductase DsbD domain-containing protein [Croceibacterium sp. D39]
MHHPRRLGAVLALLCTLVALLGAPQALAQSNHMKAELLAEQPARPGETITLALHFTPERGWHGYWLNPGDAGYGMDLKWDLPAGWQAGTPEYPVPQQLVIGGLMNHVYESDYAVLVPLTIPAGADVSAAPPLGLAADMLVCTDQICVPEKKELSLDLSQVSQRDVRFDAWRAAIPAALDRQATFELTPDSLRIAIPLPASLALGTPHVFLDQTQLIDYAAPQSFYRNGDTLVAEIPRKGIAEDPSALAGILDFGEDGQGVRFAAAPGPVPTGGTALAGGDASGRIGSLWWLLGAALLGGLILNVMPCVFPILSLKAMSLARAGESEAEARREGLAYTAGVLVATLALGGALLTLRAAGTQVGWAFQLQEPGVVVALLVLATAITANLAGLFELPSLSFTQSGGRSSAFATGLLASFVATPCTGPFMAAAMGAALLLPWWQGLILFAALGLGLALPFLLLGFVPPLRKMLPRPGKWMNTFKKVMAVPMGLTALALLWLCWRLGGTVFALGVAAVAAIVLAGLWLTGRSQHSGHKAWVPVLSSFVLAVGLGFFLLPRLYSETALADSVDEVIAAKPFSEAALAEARASGKPVFVWFTADWCLTCKVNEGVSIEREATKAAFDKAGVVPLVGDWTRRDPEITRFLTAHGAAGVPLYLWYPAGGEAQQLPQVLTPDTLVALASAS